MANTVKSNRQIWGTDFPIGGEWDAGCNQQGRWTVRLEACPLYSDGKLFSVVYQVFADHSETVLSQFLATEQGEIDAKTLALAAFDARRMS